MPTRRARASKSRAKAATPRRRMPRRRYVMIPERGSAPYLAQAHEAIHLMQNHLHDARGGAESGRLGYAAPALALAFLEATLALREAAQQADLGRAVVVGLASPDLAELLAAMAVSPHDSRVARAALLRIVRGKPVRSTPLGRLIAEQAIKDTKAGVSQLSMGPDFAQAVVRATPAKLRRELARIARASEDPKRAAVAKADLV